MNEGECHKCEGEIDELCDQPYNCSCIICSNGYFMKEGKCKIISEIIPNCDQLVSIDICAKCKRIIMLKTVNVLKMTMLDVYSMEIVYVNNVMLVI